MKKRRGPAYRDSSRRSRHQSVPLLERVEDRLLLATFTVTSTFDNTNAVAGDGSLRGEILMSNSTTTSNVIDFALPAGVQTIALKSPLPPLTTQVLIDGTSATGFTKAPLIQITGLNPTFVSTGPAFAVDAAGSELRALAINDFDGDAVDLNGGTDKVDDCYIGVDPSGTKSVGSMIDGILIASRGNTIGGIGAPGPNVISGNGGNQIEINGVNAGSNVIIDNYIGTNAAGTAALFGSIPGDGIAVETANNTIGGTITSPLDSSSLANLISGNQEGVILYTGASGNVVEGNFIGTDVTGLLAVPNVDFGVYVTGGTRNTIGGTAGGLLTSTNVISGNGNDGVRLQGSTSTNNQVQGNFIGVGADGTTAVGNGHWGVQDNAASSNVIGGSALGGNFTGLGNTIQHNDTLGGAGGVTVVSATSVGILSNSIYENGTGPGILLSGANQGVRAPVITSAQSGAGQTLISGTYTGTPGLTYTLQFFSSMMANASGIGDGQTYLLGDINVTTNSVGTANFTDKIPQVPVGYFIAGTATQGVLVTNNTSDFSTAVAVTQAQVSDLSVTTAVPTTGPQLDQPYLYTLTVTNNGPNASTGVVLTDTLPTNATVISTSGGTVASGVLTDNIGSLAAGAKVTVLVDVKPTGVGTLANTATVTGPNVDSDLTNNTSATTATVVADSDLQVSLTAGVGVAPVGSPITYTLSIGNNGPSTATNTVTTIQFPADFTNIVVVPDQGSYTISSSNLVTIMTGIVPASSASNVTIMATPTAVEQAVTTASVSSPLADPNPLNNTATSTVVVGNAADLAVTLSATPNPVQTNGVLTYTIVVTNNGPSIATAPVVYDTLPAGVSFDGLASDAGPNGTFSTAGNAITVTLQPLAVGDTDTITVAATALASGLTTNTVLVADPTLAQSNEIDPDPTNNTATVTVPVSPADILVNVINPNDPLIVGGNAVFQVQVQNSGPSTATNVILNDQFAGGGNIVAASAGPFFGPNLLTNLGSIAPGATDTVYIVVDPTASGTLTDSALVEADQFDPNPSNNSSSTTNVVSPADLSVTVAASTAPVLFGSPVLFVATVTNAGPTTANNILFGDILPANEFFGAVVASQGLIAPNAQYNALSGTLGSLAPGASATVTFYVTPSATGVQATEVAVSSSNFDPNLANNTSGAAVSVINPPGTIQFATNFADVADNAGAISLLLTRTGGSGGTVTVNYATQNYTALAGVNYVATSGTVTFQPGQVDAVITIPVIDDGVIGQTTGFFVGLSGPTGGATIGANGGAGIIVVNTDRDLIPPIVTSLIALPNGNSITGFAITFDKPMDPIRAQMLGNYYVFLDGSGAVNVGTPVALAAAQYNAVNNTVILVPTAPLPSNRFYEVLLNGSVGYALTDLSGNVLYGSGGPNTNYVAYYGQGTQLVYDDSENNAVTLNLTGGGIMGVYRDAAGDATQVNLYGVVPHSTKLSGNVQKLNKYGTGHTNIGAIYGLGAFGDVNSTLTTPEFYVGSAPVSATSIGAGVEVSADSVTASVTAKKKTPKGPRSLG